MVGAKFCDEEVQSIRNMVEEAMKVPPCKSKKKTKGKDKASSNRVKAHERTLSLVT
jgi:hypothetical protein